MSDTEDQFGGGERKGRRGDPDSRYDYLFTFAAGACGAPKQDVIDCILQDDQVKDVHDVILRDTRRTLLLFNQEFHKSWAISLDDTKRRSNTQLIRKTAIVNEERCVPLEGTAIFFMKLNVKKILTEDNTHREIITGMLDGDTDDELFCNVMQLIKYVYQPLVENLLHFGDQCATKVAIYEEILMAVQSSNSSLKVANNIFQNYTLLDSGGVAELTADLPTDPKQRTEYLRRSELAEKAEKITTDWLSVIERENSESEMLRCDWDEDSPRDEIEYWKTRSSRLNLLQQQLTGEQVQLVIQCLHLGRSKLLRRWTDALRKLSQSSHESNNNTLYLSDFENHCRTLYVWDPVRLVPCIGSLLSTVRLICCVSLYYNTSERITSLLIKITNELIRSCRRHVTNNGRETVWSRPAEVVKPLLEDCLKLHQTYRNAYATMKQDLEEYQQNTLQLQQQQQLSPQQRQANAIKNDRQPKLTCSEHSVFGKFDNFCARLMRINRLYDILDKHHGLFQGRLQGLLQDDEIMDEIERRHYAAVKDVTSRSYDYLNHRLIGFDQHLCEFEARLNDLKLYVGSYVEKVYNPVWESPQGMRFLQKFERIGTLVPLIAMENKHNRILTYLLEDFNRIVSILEVHGHCPPTPKNFSTVAGQIMWCCTLQKCLEQRLYEHAPILNSDLGREVTRKCKNLLLSLAQIGVNLLRTWKILSLATVEAYLDQTVLLLQPSSETGHYLFVVNFSPRLLIMFQEVHCAFQCGIRVPNIAAFIYSRRSVLLRMRDEAQYLVEQHKKLLDAVAPELKPMTYCHAHKLYLTLKPGSTNMCWNVGQATWNKFFAECEKALDDFHRLSVRLEDLRQNRIQRTLESLTCFSLVPEEAIKEGGTYSTMTLEEFVDMIRQNCQKATQEIQLRNQLLENSINELVELVWQPSKDPAKFFRITTESIVVLNEPSAAADRKLKLAHLRRKKSSRAILADSPQEEDGEQTRESSASTSGGDQSSGQLVRSSPETRPDSSSLPPLSRPTSASKPAQPVTQSQSVTKLPMLSSRPSSASREPKKSAAVSLPPLTSSSCATLVSALLANENHQRELEAREKAQAAADSESGTSLSDNSAVQASDYSELLKQLEEAIKNWKRIYSKRILQVLITWLRIQLDNLRHWIVPSSASNSAPVKNTNALLGKQPKPQPQNKPQQSIQLPPLFRLQAHYGKDAKVEITPSLDEVQEVAYSTGKIMLGVAKGISRWIDRPNQARTVLNRIRPMKNTLFAATNQVQQYNLYGPITDNKEVAKAVNRLSTCLMRVKTNCSEQLHPWRQFCKEICCSDRMIVVKEFQAKGPSSWDWDRQLLHFCHLEAKIKSQTDVICFGPIHITTEELKSVLLEDIHLWSEAYKNLLYRKTLRDVERLVVVFHTLEKKLDRPIRDLSDTRTSMETLRDIRSQEVDFDRAIEMVDESVSILIKHKVSLTKADVELVKQLRIAWNRLQRRSLDHHLELVAVQPTFKRQLLDSLKQFRMDSNEFCSDYELNGPMVQGLTPREASDRLVVFQNRFDALWRRQTSYEGGAELFGLPMPALAGLNRIRKELNLLQKLYRLYNDVTDRVAAYYDILWSDVNIEDINNELIEFQNRCRKLPKGLKEWPAFGMLKRIIDDFSDLCPLLELMTNKAMKPRHWLRLTEMTGHIFQVDSAGFCLRNIVEAPLLQHKEEVEDICISALKEKDIEAKLRQVTNDWTSNQLTFMTFKSRGELLLKGDAAADLISQLEDSLMVLSSLLTNRYNVPFRKPIQKWVTDLSNTNEILERWLLVQNLWVYLEAVFVGGDIAKQLPKEAKRFGKIDKAWQKIMTRAHENPNVVACCVSDDTLTQLLPHLQEELEMCQKSLSGYLEKKRLTFPRFFFVSDPALLEILGQASDSHTIQAHLLSLFDNTASVEFNDLEYDKILSIVSSEGESITLESPVRAEGSVELWLMRLLQEAHRSLHSIIRLASQAISHADVNMMDFFAAFPSQVGILGLQMMWTRDAELALSQARFDRKVMPETNAHFLEVLNTLIDQATRNLDQVERIKFETLITIHVHQRDIFDNLWRQGVRILNDFEWMKQFRFYFNTELDKLLISITDVSFTYQNEFLGCTERLVITPLTDRCYITLAQALHMCMGGCPSGPAGTGKTETTKDMGKTLGKYVVVFNCSDQMDFRGLGRIYKGLAQSGSWGCFDEFNRIELPVLSVAAQQVAVVLACKREKRPTFIFTDGELIEMNPEFGIFLTMNPDYAGRQQLPENLKNQFRFVSMMVPDRQIIIRVKLASCGFLENITLARKFYTLYKLCEEQLTKQVHYDFGLRNILSVLRTLGSSKRNNPKDSETVIVMRVLRDMNLSKLVDEDEPLFLSLIGDLFPAVALEKTSYYKLEDAIQAEIKAAGLIPHPPWILKLIQLYETQLVRHGIMILGPSGSGKTTCIQILMKALTATGKAHRELRMNPKAITCAQMFGRLDVATNDWTDGIFSALWRKTLRMKRGEHTWIVLDGPVDTLWIENLNSVLDDNRTLTLANGDRLPMSHYCKVIFEPHNIDNASPATVSRCGMVYMSSSGLDWRPLLNAWLMKKPIGETRLLRSCFEESFPTVYQWSRQNLQYKMAVLECNIINQAIALLEGLIPEEEYQNANRDKERSQSPTNSMPEIPLDDNELMDFDAKVETEAANTTLSATWTLHLRRLYIFALVWSVGALLERPDRKRLDEFIREQFPDLPVPARTYGTEEDTLFDYVVNPVGEWEHWNSRVGELIYPETAALDFSSMLVPNVDSVRIDFLLNIIAKQNRPVLLIGEQGSAKTVMINNYLKQNQNDETLHRTFNFSSATTPFQFQRMVESCVDKRMGNTYGPPAGKELVIFIDDINLPLVNEWGDQSTNEIVRQLLEMKGFYSLEKPGEFTNIMDLHFISAMIHPGGGRNDIPQRLKRHFCIFNCPLPSDSSMDKIFGTIGLGHYSAKRGYTQEVRELVDKLVPLTRKLWMATKAKMLPTPAKFHYIFNLRDLSRIWQGMTSTLPNVVDSIQVLMSLWKHECTRVIADRFTAQEDKDWFETALIDHVRDHLGEEYVQWVEVSHYFVDFMRDAPEPTGDETEEADMELPKVYEPVTSLDDLQERLTMFLVQYNDMVRGLGMDLVFFRDAVEHLIKISRTLRHPGGNVLLVGVGGSGKQSLTKLASFIAGYKTFHISLTRSYNVANFLEDLKILYRTCGVQGKGTTFIFTDQDVKEEAFLEYLNSVLSSGTVSNLFNRDEQGEIVMELIPVMKREFPRRPPTPESVLEYFMSRVRQHLHIALCFSPVGEKFRSRALKFPGLISGCTLDWFQPWPREALIAVARHSLVSFTLMENPEIRTDVEKALGSIQESVAEVAKEYFQRYRRQTHVTPKTYLTFLNSYKSVYGAKAAEIGGLCARMESGLAKLYEASETVGQLKAQLVVMEQDLAEASATAETVLVEVTNRAKEAEATKNHVLQAKDRAQRLVDVIAVEKALAEEKLAAAKPALDEAEAALNTIKPAHIATVRKLGRPPQLIMRIMDCVLILFQRKIQPAYYDPMNFSYKPSWNESLKMMASATFLQQLQNFSKETISDETVELLEPYFKAEDYIMEMAERVCGDVAGLLSWTRAMAFFFSVNKEVLPLKQNLALQEMRLSTAMTELAKAEAFLAEKEAALESVKQQYEVAMKEKKRLTEAAAICRRKMALAATLISGLSGEKLRWTVQCRGFKEQMTRLVGDAILSTAFLSYSGPFNQEFRARLLETWKKTLKMRSIPFTLNLNVTQMLSDTTQTAEWTLQGLPSDEHSLQNATIVIRSSSYPLLIDPQGQGKNWIKAKETQNELQITSLNHKYFRTHLEDSLSLGRPLLIEDVGEDLDPALDNLLNKNFIRSGTVEKVMIGDKDCDVTPGFHLYMTTKMANPAYSPEVSSKVAIIDFTVTQRGLEDQLLARVVSMERAELETERVLVFESVMENKRLIKELEDSLLRRLTSTAGSLIDDEGLITVLQETKETALVVNHKLATAAEMEHKINIAREEFRPVATRGSILYFLIVEMSHVNVMYQTSLKQFLHLFDGSMSRAMRTPNITERVQSILSTLNREVWQATLRGLYEQHQFLFTLLMAIKIDLHAGTLSHNEFMKFIKGGASLDLNAVPPKPFKWILDVTWLNLVELSSLPTFADLLTQVQDNERDWRAWIEKEKPEHEDIPCGYSRSLDPFRKLLLVRSWCPDRMLHMAQTYVSSSLGELFIDAPMLDLEAMLAESEPRVPMICILTTCSDPSTKIESLAKQKELDLQSLSMGQGQEIHAAKLLARCMGSGQWLLLQNCHLNLHFCSELLDVIMETDYIHPGFRLWITTEVHPHFPINLLQTAIKFTNEPPQGVRASLKRTFADMSQDLFEYSSLSCWPILLYTLAFLHTVLQERRKYGSLGWNLPYEFNQSDLAVCIQCVQNHLDDMDPKKGISWPTVCYMLGEAQYGGRVTDDFDKRLLCTFTQLWFSDRLLQSGFDFYKYYPLPQSSSIKSVTACLEHVSQLPTEDSPEVLGLHANADITYQINRAQAILDTIMSIQPKDGGSNKDGETREAVVYRLVEDMLQKMPKEYVEHEVKEALNRMGPLLPMSIFLRQEIDRMQRVIKMVRAMLVDLKLAIEGTIIMSMNLRDAMDSMYDARVPNMWKGISWESSTLGFWFTEFLERNNQFSRWCFYGKPKVFWMAGFFNPQGFLTAMRQEVTRAHRGWALDSVVLHSAVTRLNREEVTEPPAEGVYIHGLFLEGASLDRKTGKLIEPKPKVLYDPMPVIYVYAVQSSAGKDPRMYECPIYRKPIRNTVTYIGSIDLETDVNPRHWTLRGVALLCDIK